MLLAGYRNKQKKNSEFRIGKYSNHKKYGVFNNQEQDPRLLKEVGDL
jgi:hypothetical protein